MTENKNALEHFELNLLFKGECIYLINTMFEYQEEEDDFFEGNIRESYDAEDIYRLIEQYDGEDLEGNHCYRYYVLKTSRGGTMEDEEKETIRVFSEYKKLEDAIKFIETDRLKYLNCPNVCYGVHKIREDIKALIN